MATTSVFAFSTATDQPNTAYGGLAGAPGVSSPSNQTSTSTIAPQVVTPGNSTTFVASYTYASATTGALNYYPVGTMWQQWLNDSTGDWFYLYAVNTAATTTTAPTFNIRYYSKTRGVATIAGGIASNTAVAATAMTISTLYEDTGTAIPLFHVNSVQVNAPNNNCFAAANSSCSTSFSTTLVWGKADSAWKQTTVTLRQAVESMSMLVGSNATAARYYQGWQNAGSGGAGSQLSLSDANTPAQASTGVTNASGSRSVNLGSAYQMAQTVTDSDGDLAGGSIIYVSTSASTAGQWFQFGYYNTPSNQGNDIPGTTGTFFYQSWNEAMTTASTTTAGGTTPAITTNYLTQASVTFTTQTNNGTLGAVPGQGVTSQTVTYNLIYSSTARGSWTLFGRAEDEHGKTSGNVQVGTQTIS